MHDDVEVNPDLITELREAITNLARTSSRSPAHWVDRKAEWHHRINQLLDLLEELGGLTTTST